MICAPRNTPDPTCARLLIDAGAEVNAATANGITPLIAAAFRGKNEVIRLLLAHGANINAIDLKGYTALMRAEEKGYFETAEILKQAAAQQA